MRKKIAALISLLLCGLLTVGCGGAGSSTGSLDTGTGSSSDTGSGSDTGSDTGSPSGSESSSAGGQDAKVMDLYVILGQSNALGISQMDLLTDSQQTQEAYNTRRDSNIYYYGGEKNEYKEEYTKVAFAQ